MKFRIPTPEEIKETREHIKAYELAVKTGGDKNSGYSYRRENQLYDAFTTQDIVLYFRDKANESGHHYMVSLEKDRGIIARLKNELGFTSRELVDIIDFMFEECNYITNPTINVLGSRWINTLSVDAKNWKLGTYTPSDTRNNTEKLTEERNYNAKEEHKVTIGEW